MDYKQVRMHRQSTVSIIIPTHDRFEYLRRLLEYYREVKCPHGLVVADSSSRPMWESNDMLIASLGKYLNITHQKCLPRIGFVGKIAQALDSCGSTYAVLVGDDDFVIPETLTHCARFLDSHPKYSSVQGYLLKATKERNRLRISFKNSYFPELDDPILRLKQHFSSFSRSVFYTVRRTSQLIGNFHKVASLKWSSLAEDLLDSLSVVQGQRKTIDLLYGVRQALPSCERQISKGTLDDCRSLLDAISGESFFQEFQSFSDYLSEEIIKYKDISMEEAKREIYKIFWAYVVHYYNNQSIQSNLSVDASPSHRPRRFKKDLKQLAHVSLRALSMMPLLSRIAVIDRQLINLIKFIRVSTPMQVYNHLREERGVHLTLPALLDRRSRFYEDFAPIYKYLTRDDLGVHP